MRLNFLPKCGHLLLGAMWHVSTLLFHIWRKNDVIV